MTRQRRGRRSEIVLAAYLREHGWPFAAPVGAGAGGADVTNVPGISLELKARKDFSPLAWVRQASKRPGLAVGVLRANGQGEDAGEWLAMVRVCDLLPLLWAMGYGTPPVDLAEVARD